MDKDVLIDVKRLTVVLGGKRIVKDINFQVNEGEIVGMFGISGAGKTTILRALICQFKKKRWAGEINVLGMSPANRRDRVDIIRSVGYVPQFEHDNLYPTLTPLQNMEFFGSVYEIGSKESRTISKRLFTILDIPRDVWKNNLGKMSGGEKKRVSFAIGMINAPKILFLDEPTTGIDASRRYDILNYLKRLNQEMGTTMFLISHDLESALICDKCAILKEGRLLEFGSPDDLISALPSGGKIARLVFNEISNNKIKRIREFEPVKRVLRAGSDVLEVFMDDFDENFPRLIQLGIQNDLGVISVTKDTTDFKRYFQVRVQLDEEMKEVTLSAAKNKA